MGIDQLFHQFSSKRILVIGDVMVDAYIRGKVTRVSPEAPVPIVTLEKQEDRLGGAANVAVNLVAMGAQAVVCSVIGNDANSQVLTQLLLDSGISGDGLIQSETRKTTVKTRVIGNNQQLLRVDSEQTNPISSAEGETLVNRVNKLMDEGCDGIIFEDYNKGVLIPDVIQQIIKRANERGIPTAVDPKKDNFLAYQGVTLFKPNLKELKEGLGVEFSFVNEKQKFEDAVQLLETKLSNTISFVTLSEHGVYIKQGSESVYCPAHVRNIADVSGAGDTVISLATLCLICQAPLALIAEVSNIAGGLVCETSGVVSIDSSQLLAETDRLIK